MENKKGIITEKTIDHLLELSRMNINENEKERLAKDLNGIVDYISELDKISTENVDLNLDYHPEKKLRDDIPRKEAISNTDTLIEAFRQRRENWLKIPPVFDR